MASPQTSTAATPLLISSTEGFADWLQQQEISLAFTTYQTNRLFLIGCKEDGKLAANERLFDKPMGLFLDHDSLLMACRYQIWALENRLAPGETYQGADRLYIPSVAHTTGDINAHDVVMTASRRLLFMNTDFSCLAALKPGYSFEPVWQPPFISKLAAEDRCHLNGLALENGEPAYVTACSRTDTAAGWREHRVQGGVVMHLPSNEIVLDGLSMPHSPRHYRQQLWLLNSGTGELGHLAQGQFNPVAFLPGFVRGLAFHSDYALIGLSKLRSRSFSGLALEDRLAALGLESQCGLAVVDLNSGQVLHTLAIGGVVEELFDVVVLAGVRQPRALGFQDDDIGRLVSFPGAKGVVVTKPTVHRPGLGPEVQVAGLPRPSQLADETPAAPPPEGQVKFQRVFHLTPDNLLPYEAMTSPSLKARWQTQPQRGELLGLSASVGGAMVGFAIAEKWTDSQGQLCAELISLYALPDHRAEVLKPALCTHLQALVGMPLAGLSAR